VKAENRIDLPSYASIENLFTNFNIFFAREILENFSRYMANSLDIRNRSQYRTPPYSIYLSKWRGQQLTLEKKFKDWTWQHRHGKEEKCTKAQKQAGFRKDVFRQNVFGSCSSSLLLSKNSRKFVWFELAIVAPQPLKYDLINFCQHVLSQWFSNGRHLAHSGRNFESLGGNLLQEGIGEETQWEKNKCFIPISLFNT